MSDFGNPSFKVLTRKRANAHLDLPEAPGERTIKAVRKAELLKRMAEGTFWGPSWVTCFCLEDHTLYRLDGLHTSTILSQEGAVLTQPNGAPFVITYRHVQVETLAEMRKLFSQFNDGNDSRTPSEKVKIYSGSLKGLKGVQCQTVNACVRGLIFAIRGKIATKRHGSSDGEILEGNEGFVLMMDKIIGLWEPIKSADVLHFRRKEVVAVMYRTFLAEPDLALEFWTDVRDQEGRKNGPARRLSDYLIGRHRGRQTVQDIESRTQECGRRWNAWCRQHDSFNEDVDTDVDTDVDISTNLKRAAKRNT